MIATEVRVARDRKSLTVKWSDGTSSAFGAALLRRHGQSGDAVRARIDGHETPPGRDIAIVRVKAIGAYAINIVFSDGYHRGIYPWTYLAQLEAESAPGPAAMARIA